MQTSTNRQNSYQSSRKYPRREVPFCLLLRCINSRSPNCRITSMQNKGNPVFKNKKWMDFIEIDLIIKWPQ
jgi:hypothetical protein